MPTYDLSLHIFRRDLRLQDNSSLIAALQSSKLVMVCFIFDDRQINANNPYRSENAIQFMLASLKELHDEIQKKSGRLYFFNGISEDVVAKLTAKYPIEAVFINRDYTPFARKRDKAIQTICEDSKIDFHVYADALLHEPEQILKSNGKPYTIYTPAARYARQFPVTKPHTTVSYHFYNKEVSLDNFAFFEKLLSSHQKKLYLKGGRKEGLQLISKIEKLKDYAEMRNFPAQHATTHLSAHHKFGTVSIREVYYKIADSLSIQHTLINELYWRDFFTHIGFHFPNVFKEAFQEKFKNIKWSKNEKYLLAWQEGKTGFPIVDAGMRELNATGYMHNRVRMIVASFLCKDLHLNWQLGEQYFANLLVDYDPAVNNGNWQWAASTGCDAQPYFRIFNPWLQQVKFDNDCSYIRQWIPEISHLSDKEIHHWYEATSKSVLSYPRPIVDHAIASKATKTLYQT